jgi:hypothetical protein
MKTVSSLRCFLSAALCTAAIGCDSNKLIAPSDAAVGADGLRDRATADQALPSDVASKDGLPDAERADKGVPDVVDHLDAPATDARIADSSVRDGLADAAQLDVPAPDASKADASRGDGALDRIPPCGPGGGGCNDDPTVSSIWGTCGPDGACVCKANFEINPGTGRCRPMVPAADAAEVCPGPYDACGCGCCSATPTSTACYYPTAGETLAMLKAKDDEAKARIDCNTAGCSPGVRYVCCMPGAPDPASSATYTSDSYSGDMDHINLSKTGPDCAQLTLSRPATTKSTFRIDGPASWGVMYASFGSCPDGGAGSGATGALGAIALHTAGDQCLIDVHVTLFGFTSAGETKRSQLDVDGLPVKGFLGAICK